MEPCGDFTARPHVQAWRTQGSARRRRLAVLRGVGAGRLENDEQADAEPRRALRLDDRLVRTIRGVPALHGEGAPAGRRQHPAEAWLCLSVERSHGHPWRLWQVFRRSDHASCVVRARAGHDRRARGSQRRPTGLCAQPVQRPGTYLRAGAHPVLLGARAGGQLRSVAGPKFRGCGAVCPPGGGRDGSAGAVRARTPHVADVHRRAATDREFDVG